MKSKLEQLKEFTEVVADTGDIEAMKKYKPQDATTNPSLLLKVAPQYPELLDSAIAWSKSKNTSNEQEVRLAMAKFSVSVGCEILNLIPGRISTEVDARLSFDTQATINKAREIISLYQQSGIGKERILIKIASTWEGIAAAEVLEKENINCNLTLLFCLPQAIACADVGVFLISPFVGRILDWHKKISGKESYKAIDDPGVQSLTNIYQYYKQHRFDTVVMGASFRNQEEIEQLAGCDRLTISPALLESMEQDKGLLVRQLNGANSAMDIDKISYNEAGFRYALNDNAMATEKLAEGIRSFIADQEKLEQIIINSVP